MADDQVLLEAIEALTDDLRAVRQMLRRDTDMDIAQTRLTGPQISVLRILVASDGLSLKALSQRVRLAHSTVSGIVDRLEREGLVQRVLDDHDRRLSRIRVSERVKGYWEKSPALHRPETLVRALSSVDSEERTRILGSVARLRQLLERVQDEHDS